MIIVNLALPQSGRNSEQLISFKFDSGTGEVDSGYTQVLPTTVYSTEVGYGILSDTTVVSVDRGGDNALRSDFCTSDKPFLFVVDVPPFDPAHPDPIDSWSLPISPAISANGEPKRYLITDYGAIGDGQTLNTKAIQSAIDQCASDRGGVVVVPAGTFMTGAIFLK